MASQQQLNNLLLKNVQGAAYTDINQPANLEAIGSSVRRVAENTIMAQHIPIPAPAVDTSGITLPTGGIQRNSTDIYYPYITK